MGWDPPSRTAANGPAVNQARSPAADAKQRTCMSIVRPSRTADQPLTTSCLWLACAMVSGLLPKSQLRQNRHAPDRESGNEMLTVALCLPIRAIFKRLTLSRPLNTPESTRTQRQPTRRPHRKGEQGAPWLQILVHLPLSPVVGWPPNFAHPAHPREQLGSNLGASPSSHGPVSTLLPKQPNKMMLMVTAPSHFRSACRLPAYGSGHGLFTCIPHGQPCSLLHEQSLRTSRPPMSTLTASRGSCPIGGEPVHMDSIDTPFSSAESHTC
ncbi:hypothetical protein BT67DRAFT_184764 [Trichocladium antarcticum]|uniref:Uncharacterized protein n=1 Tax=Trichocladium antarcticum TaxID=1450529 RepID=A0AAN6ZEX0_9PEZI|nr:hypothetical protein BT67DRAFT_184764 [Trichocladium antarcticum]